MRRKYLQLKCEHLDEVQMNYFRHLLHAWRMGLILFVHGLLPWIWETKVSNEILDYENSVSKSKGS